MAAVRRIEAQREGKTFRRKVCIFSCDLFDKHANSAAQAWGSSVATPAQQRRSGSVVQQGKQRTTTKRVQRQRQLSKSPTRRPQSASTSRWGTNFSATADVSGPKSLFSKVRLAACLHLIACRYCFPTECDGVSWGLWRGGGG